MTEGTTADPEPVIHTEDILAEPEWKPAANISEALARVQRSISHIGKDGRSTEGGNYSFRRIDDVIKGLHPILAREGVLIYPAEQEIIENLQPVPGRKEAWSKLTIRVTYRAIYGRSNPVGGTADFIEFSGIGIGLDNGDKGPGKALSYAYKSAVSQLFSIPTDDPGMDAEMTPEDPTWWGGWDNAEEHNHMRAKLLEGSLALADPWKANIRAVMEDNNLLTEHGQILGKIARWQMNKWAEALESITFMSQEEPFGLGEQPESGPGSTQASSGEQDGELQAGKSEGRTGDSGESKK